MYRLLAFLSAALAIGATLITNDPTGIPSSFEYIIIGGGTAGLAVANRLSVNHSVLVIERGDDQRDDEVRAWSCCLRTMELIDDYFFSQNINNPLIATGGCVLIFNLP
jgi:cation diffusion facilitator CzcD-associated flavoprotein CzcO